MQRYQNLFFEKIDVLALLAWAGSIGFNRSTASKFRAMDIGWATKIAKVTVTQVVKKFPGDGELWIETMVTICTNF